MVTRSHGTRSQTTTLVFRPWGYEEILAILADPSHPEREERVMWVDEWADGALDPEAFDPADLSDNLQNLRLAALD